MRYELASRDSLILLARDAGGTEKVREDLDLVVADPTHGTAYARDVGTDSASSFAARLSEHSRCYLVLSDGRVLHASWVTTWAAWTREVRGYFVPPPGDAYVYESFTHPEARGRGIYPFTLCGICAREGARGAGRMWVGVEIDNAPSLRAITKAGFEEVFRLSYRRSWGRLEVELPSGPRAALAAAFYSREAPPLT